VGGTSSTGVELRRGDRLMKGNIFEKRNGDVREGAKIISGVFRRSRFVKKLRSPPNSGVQKRRLPLDDPSISNKKTPGGEERGHQGILILWHGGE